jgi:cephalosporin hydroxylase
MWMGRAIWKNPLGCWVYLEILYYTEPEAIVGLSVAHGDGTLYLANLLYLLGNSSAQAIGIEPDLSRVTNLRHACIKLMGGNCLDPAAVRQVTDLCKGRKTYE